MNQLDQMRFAEIVSGFLSDCEIEPPLFLTAIGANGAVVVSRHTPAGNEELCATGTLMTPIVLTVVGFDGRGKSMRIEVAATRQTLQ